MARETIKLEIFASTSNISDIRLRSTQLDIRTKTKKVSEIGKKLATVRMLGKVYWWIDAS
jgi:hypothetical protein